MVTRLGVRSLSRSVHQRIDTDRDSNDTSSWARVLAVFGRAILVGITDRAFEIYPYAEVLGKEAEIIGSSDHLVSELPILLDIARRGLLDLSSVITRTVPLEATAVNETLDELEHFGESVRTVIVP